MIQLSITSDGLSAKTRNSDLIFTCFIAGSGIDENNEEIQIQKQIIPISFSQIYNAGDTYTLNGASYVEEINHIKIVGTLLSSEASNDYTLKEIALMAKEGAEGQEFCFAYGSNAQSGITISQSENTSYSLVMDIIFDTTPNVSINTTGTGVTYSDLITHTNGKVSNNTIHGIKYENGDLKINNVSLDICKNIVFQKTTGATVYDSLPATSILYNNKLAYNKSTGSLYRCVKTTEISVGDYVYELSDIWYVGDGTENGALEVVADSAEPSSNEIKLSVAQSHFMQWTNVNNFDTRLSLVENVSLGGITDIINTLQSQITAINNSLSNPFPAWTAEKVYEVGDICIVNTFKSYQYLECVVAGTTGATMPAYADVGQMITDNEVKWIVCDFRDSALVGTYKTDVVQRKGWLKANGAEVNRADYPRLWSYAVDNLLTTNDQTNNPGLFGEGDGVDTFELPNFEDYFIRYSYARGVGSKQASQMASHTHSCGNHSGTHSHTASNQSANHTHQFSSQIVEIQSGNGAHIEAIGGSGRTTTSGMSENHTHTINSTTIAHKHSIENTGNGSNTYPDNITMQMYIKY